MTPSIGLIASLVAFGLYVWLVWAVASLDSPFAAAGAAVLLLPSCLLCGEGVDAINARRRKAAPPSWWRSPSLWVLWPVASWLVLSDPLESPTIVGVLALTIGLFVPFGALAGHGIERRLTRRRPVGPIAPRNSPPDRPTKG